MRLSAIASALSRMHDPQYIPAAPAARIAMRRRSAGAVTAPGGGAEVVEVESMCRILGHTATSQTGRRHRGVGAVAGWRTTRIDPGGMRFRSLYPCAIACS